MYLFFFFLVGWWNIAHQEALKREIERLREIYYQQNLKKLENDDDDQPTKTQTAAAADANGSEKKEQLVN